MDFLSHIGALIGSIGIAVISLFGAPTQPEYIAVPQLFGAALPSAAAVFETSLAAPISSSATSLTLAANSVRGGGTISGHACFTIDEGSSQAEFTCGTVSGTSVTSLSRGISPSTGTTTVAALQFSHRRGASVKITDFPLIQILKAQANGEDTYPHILRYTSHPTFASTVDIVDKKYVDDAAFSGASVIDATAAARGVVELATGAEAAASTAAGSSGALALPSSIATSTYNAATSVNIVPITDGTGKIDEDWLPTAIANAHTFNSGAQSFATSSINIGAFPAYNIGKNIRAFTSTGTTTFAIPSGITKLKVRVQAGGGGSGGNTTANEAGAGGGGGGYAEEFVDVSATSTVQIYVGSGGTPGAATGGAGGAGERSTFGTVGFEFLTATAGAGGTQNGAGGAGGAGSGGDINRSGQSGGYGHQSGGGPSGAGGNSVLGFGAPSGASSDVVGANGVNYGGGAAGANNASGADVAGGTGAQGVVILEW